MSKQSLVDRCWQVFRHEILPDEMSPDEEDVMHATFLAGFRSCLISFQTLDKPEYAVVRTMMIEEAKRDCDAVLKADT